MLRLCLINLRNALLYFIILSYSSVILILLSLCLLDVFVCLYIFYMYLLMYFTCSV